MSLTWFCLLENLQLRYFLMNRSHRSVKSNGNISKDRSQRRNHGYSINLIIKLTVKNKMSL